MRRFGLLVLGIAAILAAAPGFRGQAPAPIPPSLHQLKPNPQVGAPQGVGPEESSMTAKQKRDLLKYNFTQMKKDSQELATLAKSLQDDLERSNQNVLSVGVIEKAEKIEKLAKKIKDSAKGAPNR